MIENCTNYALQSVESHKMHCTSYPSCSKSSLCSSIFWVFNYFGFTIFRMCSLAILHDTGRRDHAIFRATPLMHSVGKDNRAARGVIMNPITSSLILVMSLPKTYGFGEKCLKRKDFSNLQKSIG